MRKDSKVKRPASPEFTAVKMEPALYRKARRRARLRYQTYSEYVRQLIVRDVTKNGEEATINA